MSRAPQANFFWKTNNFGKENNDFGMLFKKIFGAFGAEIFFALHVGQNQKSAASGGLLLGGVSVWEGG